MSHREKAAAKKRDPTTFRTDRPDKPCGIAHNPDKSELAMWMTPANPHGKSRYTCHPATRSVDNRDRRRRSKNQVGSTGAVQRHGVEQFLFRSRGNVHPQQADILSLIAYHPVRRLQSRPNHPQAREDAGDVPAGEIQNLDMDQSGQAPVVGAKARSNVYEPAL